MLTRTVVRVSVRSENVWSVVGGSRRPSLPRLDGRPDLAVANFSSNSVSVLLQH